MILFSSCKEKKIIYIAAHTAECQGVGPQQCMLIRESPDQEWEFFYDQIEGFAYEPGFEYEIEVEIETIKNPPADGSSLQYTLVETISKVRVQAEAFSDQKLEGDYEIIVLKDNVDLKNEKLTMHFDSTNATVSGFAGCNQYKSSYEIEKNTITLDFPITTRKACPDKMELEKSFMKSLSEVRTFQQDSGQLELRNEKGEAVITAISIE